MIPPWLKDVLAGGRGFLLSSHVNPDADGTGACAGMAWLLETLGKPFWIVNTDRLPPAFRFIEDLYPVHNRVPAEAAAADVWICLDSSKKGRTGVTGVPAGCLTVNIDHHFDNEVYARHNWVDPKAPATSELIFRLIRAYGLFPAPKVAEALYAGVLIDTGGFKFSNTNARAFAMSAALAGRGLNPHRLYKTVFLEKSEARMRLEGRLLSRARVLEEGRLCLMEVDDALLRETGATDADLEGISNLTLAVKGVEVGVMLIAQGGKTKACFRSDGIPNVRDLASRFGGGGHAAASGCTLETPMAAASDLVFQAAKSALSARAL